MIYGPDPREDILTVMRIAAAHSQLPEIELTAERIRCLLEAHRPEYYSKMNILTPENMESYLNYLVLSGSITKKSLSSGVFYACLTIPKINEDDLADVGVDSGWHRGTDWHNTVPD